MASVSLGGVLQAEYKYDYLGRQFSRKLVPSNTVIHSVFRSDGKRISEYRAGSENAPVKRFPREGGHRRADPALCLDGRHAGCGH
jgi:hypothetical protein